MASDGKIEIELEVKDSNAQSQGKKAGDQISKGVEQGIKNVGKSAQTAAKDTEKSFQNAANSAKSSFSDVGSAAKNSFGDVGDAAKTAAGDAAGAFEEVPADAAGAFSDVSSEAEAGFSGVADAAEVSATGAVDAFDGAGDQIGEELEGAGDKAKGVFGTDIPAAAAIAGAAIAAVAAKALEIGKNSVQTGAEFDAAMSQVAATMGVTTDEITELTDFAKQMGETTAFSASQSAEALNYMALAGYDAETSMRVLPTVLNLAAAGSMDLARASDMVTDAQSALGLSVEEAEVMVDQMAKTSSKTNTSVEQLGDAFLTVGGTAKNLKGGTAELSQMLGLLADNGVKGAEGGTALRNVILSLSAPTDKAAKVMEELGLSVFDAEGNMRPMPDIFNDLNSAMSPLTQQEKTNVLNDIFNKVDLKSVNALLGTSADRFDEVGNAIANAQGSAQKMAETQLDNLAGDVTLLESATEGFYIAVSDQLSPALRGLTQFGTNTLMPFLTTAVKNFDKFAPAIIAAAVAFVALQAKGKVVSTVSGYVSKLTLEVNKQTVAFKSLTVAQKAQAVATDLCSKAMKALKAAAPILILTTLVEVGTLVADAFAKADERTKKFESSTKGLESAASGVKVRINEETGAFEGLGDAVSRVNLEEIVDQHIELAKTINDSAQAAANSQAMLDQYGGAIEQLAGRSDLSETEVAKLKLAVDGVNDAMGTSYEVIQDDAGAYQIMADGAAVAASEVLNLIDAQKAQIRAEAELEQFKATYEQLAQDNKALAEAANDAAEKTRIYEEAQRRANEAQASGDESAQQLVDQMNAAEQAMNKANDSLHEMEGQVGSTQSALNKLEEQQILTNMAMEDGASAELKAADANLAYKSGVQAVGVDLVAFTKHLIDMGKTSDEIADMSAEDAMELARAWQGGTSNMVASADNASKAVPDAMRQMGDDAYNETYIGGQKAGQGFTAGLSEKAQTAVDAALNTVGMTRDEFDKLAEQAGIEGDEAGMAFANAIAAKSSASQKAGETDATSAKRGLGSKDGSAEGAALGTQFATGVSSKDGAARSAGEVDAQAAKGGLQSEDGNAETWGFHLGDLFASGIRAAQDAVRNAGNFIAGIIQSILGHSVAKEGPLHEGGKGEYKWGLHLVQNIADGMTSSQARKAVRDASREVAVDINDTLQREMAAINPIAQLEESLSKGSAAFNMSAMMVGAAPTYTTNNQTLNFNGDVQSPDIIAREMRLQQYYGLAGRY